ncbi:MAG: hypothetical protein HY928_18090 [Elusimicrobia bacterium]|nr:hypothetical protein [Elusimicrobiota bacterium]
MNAAEYLAFARPLLSPPARASARGPGGPEAFFLSLPESLLDAAGAGHFLESAASSTRGLERVKLALVLADGPADLVRDARRRDAPGAAAAVRALARTLGAGYDQRVLAGVLDCLGRWELRGSLMLSLDFDRARGAFDKLSLYGYLPGPPALAALLGPFGLGGREAELRPLAGPTLAFFGVDLPPGGAAVLKFYNKTPLPDRALSGPAAEALGPLGEVAPLRDVTRLTRVGAAGAIKSYLGFARGAPLKDLARLRLFGGAQGWLGEAARAAAGARARFVGFDGGAVEVYFDRSGFGPAEDSR